MPKDRATTNKSLKTISLRAPGGPVGAAEALQTLPPGKVAPTDLGPAGARFWTQVQAALDLDGHETVLLLEICRSIDLLEQLDAVVRDQGPLVKTRAGTRPHAAAVEARQQRVVLARLIASLRLPDGWSDPTPASRPTVPLRRPQRRGAAYGTRSL